MGRKKKESNEINDNNTISPLEFEDTETSEFKLINNIESESLNTEIEKLKESETKKDKKDKKDKKGKDKDIDMDFKKISFLPIMIFNIIFNRLKWDLLDINEESQLKIAFENFIDSLPPAFIKVLSKASGIIGLVIVMYSIISTRVEKQNKENKIDKDKKIEDELVKEFS